jgi:hypothetical protein
MGRVSTSIRQTSTMEWTPTMATNPLRMSDEEAKFRIVEMLKSAGVRPALSRVAASDDFAKLLNAFRAVLRDNNFCENCASDETGRSCMCQDNS